MNLEKFKKYLGPAYILLLLFSVIYIHSVLKTGDIKILEKEDKTVVKVKPIEVVLEIRGRQYNFDMKNVDSVMDLFEKAYKEKVFSFERTFYTYGVEINQINGQEAPEGYKWAVFYNDKEITQEIGKTMLEGGGIYSIRSVKLQ